jgi:glycosyltransferase involved in cell wall biosynthesis
MNLFTDARGCLSAAPEPVTVGGSEPGPFRGQPIRLVDPQDPLVLLKEFRATRSRIEEMNTGSPPPRIGFACLWDRIPEYTWSHSAWNLRAALRLATDTTDIGVQIPRLSRIVLQALHTRRRAGRLITTWKYYSRLTDYYIEHALRRELSRNPAARRRDAVLTIHDLAVLPVPFFIYTDTSYDAVMSAVGGIEAYADMRFITPSTVARRRERQLDIYERATGIIAESQWLARSLVEQSGVPSGKIHVAPPGISADQAPRNGSLAASPANGRGGHQLRPPLPERAAPRRRLLFVGGEFHRKGGDLVIAALAVLRREHDPQITLTIAGPRTWPLPGTPPDGVRFLGSLPSHEVAALYDCHDLFVMPSRLEPFGLVFAEALARGLPCVARDAFAMPEIITPGVSGALITRDDENELAAAISAALANDALYESCYQRAPEVAEYFSWERTALQVSAVITQVLGPAPCFEQGTI